ncbi:CD209 antigen-like protein 2 [Cloeon dipterum]|uniref:CD209 antigen-like protein 2 n=1 Tax=Cloeon dipterum TaxID=197152 RepID=UPI00321F6A15
MAPNQALFLVVALMLHWCRYAGAENAALQSKNIQATDSAAIPDNSSATCEQKLATLQTELNCAREKVVDLQLLISVTQSFKEENSRLTGINQEYQLALCEQKLRACEMEKQLHNENCNLRIEQIFSNFTSRLTKKCVEEEEQDLHQRCSAIRKEPDGIVLEINTLSGCYFISLKKENWFTAVRACRSLGMQLATIETAEENYHLVKALGKVTIIDNFWLSATRLGAEDGAFYWSTTGQRLEFASWNKKEPNNAKGNESCVQFSDLKGNIGWNDEDCFVHSNYICELVSRT